MRSELVIRPAVIGDTDTILRFIRDLAIFENAENEVLTTAAHVHRTIFSEGATAHALICESAGKPIGFAVYFYNYSTWQGRNGVYLEDLYIDPEARGMGAGKAMLKHIAKIAVDNDCGRFEWSVLDWNTPAIKVYDSIGAKPQSEWIRYRLTGDALLELASS
ncbi:GNAT family N-acetyltransferase [Diaphorobacter sp. HDW4A]|uniref:GNAT family N-acetyltransferase n=1 Tax=Diaphorobacter sp. HDW4A TaxID=2714924 RepID=UPI0014073027|nr:GNAT family N-acetyltransferase [Diaphorobacter sp. HDW4A]QIL83563.1 GNAT family N-acetyltransferase [Diaphorobacter sp. HDW4A]